MREGWRVGTIAELSTVLRRGVTPSYVDANAIDSVLIVNQKCINNGQVDLANAKTTKPVSALKEDRMLHRGDVLVCSTGRGTLGRSSLWTQDMPATADSHVTIVRGTDEVADGYLALVLGQREREIESYGTGSTNMTELSPKALGSMSMLLPPVPEQRRIVDLIGALDDAIEAAGTGVEMALYSEILTQTMNGDKQAPLSAALTQSKESVTVNADEEYPIIGVLRSGEGFIHRGPIAGAAMAYPRLSVVTPGRLVYRKLTAWEGPISVSTESEKGTFVSSEFPVFDIDPEVLLPDLMRHFCRWSGLWKRMEGRLVGSVLRRKRLNPDQFLEVNVAMASLEEQQEALELLDAAWMAQMESSRYAQSLRTLRTNILAACLGGEHEIPSSYDEVMGVIG